MKPRIYKTRAHWVVDSMTRRGVVHYDADFKNAARGAFWLHQQQLQANHPRRA